MAKRAHHAYTSGPLSLGAGKVSTPSSSLRSLALLPVCGTPLSADWDQPSRPFVPGRGVVARCRAVPRSRYGLGEFLAFGVLYGGSDDLRFLNPSTKAGRLGPRA